MTSALQNAYPHTPARCKTPWCAAVKLPLWVKGRAYPVFSLDTHPMFLDAIHMSTTSYKAAIDHWKQAIGTASVITDPEQLAAYQRNVGEVTRHVPVVLKPISTEQVKSIVDIANTHHVALYPISHGRNWGLGSRIPVTDNTVVVDLSGMNKIHEVNVEGCYAVIEPGVTQGQLYDYITEHKLPLVVNITGAARETSLIGNALERGVGYFKSKAYSLSAMEVVLGNGTIIKTGFGHFENAKTTHYYKHGIGPSLDGLFSQSNYGIVTTAGVELLPAADKQVAIVTKIDNASKLNAFIDGLAALRRKGIVQTIFHIGNQPRTQIALGPLLFKQLKQHRSEDDETLRRITLKMIEKEGFGPWSAIGGIMGTAAQIRLAKREIRKVMKGLAQTIFIDTTLVNLAKKASDLLFFVPFVKNKRLLLNAIEPLFNLTIGIPTDAAMYSVYWPVGSLPETAAEDPDQSICGMLFCVPFFPANGDVAAKAVRHIEQTYQQYGFEPYITLNMVTDHSLEAVINMAFDRTNPEQVKAAHECTDKLNKDFIQQGFPPYRVGTQAMLSILDKDDTYWQTVRDMKKILDPNNIISPGRYNLI